MLEFIVLGRIPGTSIQITFFEFFQLLFLIVTIIIIGIELKIHKIRRSNLQKIISRLG